MRSHTAYDLIDVAEPPPVAAGHWLSVYWAQGQPLRSWVILEDGTRENLPDISATPSVGGVDPGASFAHTFALLDRYPSRLELAWVDAFELYTVDLLQGGAPARVPQTQDFQQKPTYRQSDGRLYWIERNGLTVHVMASDGGPPAEVGTAWGGGSSALEGWHRDEVAIPFSPTLMQMLSLDDGAIRTLPIVGGGSAIPTHHAVEGPDLFPGAGTTVGGAGFVSGIGWTLRRSAETSTGRYFIGSSFIGPPAEGEISQIETTRHFRMRVGGSGILYPYSGPGTGRWLDTSEQNINPNNSSLGFTVGAELADPGVLDSLPHLHWPLSAARAPWES